MPADIQRVVDNCTFLTDGLFAAIKLLWTICDTGKSVAKLSSELPDFYVSRKITDSPFDASSFSCECEKNGIISDVKKRQRYEKPSEERKRIETSARRKRLKELAEANRKRLY